MNDYGIKNLRTAATGPEGDGFSLTLYYKGKRVALISNDGWGGCNRTEVITPKGTALMGADRRKAEVEHERRALAILKLTDGWWHEFMDEDTVTGYDRDESPDNVYSEALDTLVGLLIEEHEQQKWAKSILRSKWAILTKDGRVLTWPKRKVSKDRFLTGILQPEYDGKRVLNDLPAAEAITLILSHAGG